MSTNSLFTSMVHVLALLASTDEPLSSSWIAQSVNTNPVVIRQVVGHLRDAGLVVTTPGCTGGARLAKDAAQITLDDVYQLVRQDTFFGLHANAPNPHCPVGRNIQGVLLDVFEPSAAQTFDQEVGVNNSYLYADFFLARVDQFGKRNKLDLSDITWTVGLAVEF